MKLKNIFKTKPLSEEKQLIYDIVRQLCNHPASKLVIYPQAYEYFIENLEHNYFCVISLDSIKITNHVFYKEIVLELTHLEALIAIFLEAVKSDRDRMKQEGFDNSIELLKKISNSLKIEE